MPAVDLQTLAQNFNPVVRQVVEASRDRWLTADEMHILFQNRHLFPLSDFTVPAPGLYLVQTSRFVDDHEWDNFPNGRRLRSCVLPGIVSFNYSLAQSPEMLRRTIRNSELFNDGGNAFVHYLQD